MKSYLNYKNLSVFLHIFVVSLFFSCSDTYQDGSYAEADNYYLSLSTAYDLNANPEGGNVTLSIDAPNNTDWSLSDVPSWINPSSGWGTGKSSVTLDVIQNPSFTQSRTAVLYIGAKGGNQWQISRPITVSQNPRAKSLYMYSTDGNYSFTHNSKSVTLSVYSNIEWEIISDAPFVTFSKSSGTGNATITMNVAAYSSDDAVSRVANISLIEKSTRTVFQRQTITQEAKGVTRHTGYVDFTDAAGSVSRTNLGNTAEGFTASSNASWLTVTPTSGTGSIGITMKATANTTTSSRTATVTVNIKGSSTPFYEFYVTQAGKKATFSLSESSHSFGCYKSTTYPKITTNTTWKASSNASWLTVSPTSGSGDTELTVSATSDNPNSTARKGTITFTYEGQTKTYEVTQAAAGITLSGSTFNFSADGATNQLFISGTGSWTATKDVSWLTMSKTSGYDNAEITLTASKNTSTSSRSGKITVKSQNGTTHTANVQQYGAVADYVTLSPEQLIFNADATYQSTNRIDVTASGTWTASKTESWLRFYQYNTYVNVYVDANTSTTSRTAYITFTCGTATKTAKITQEAPKHNGHEYVDLGLPSGLKWATCNIGASAPVQVGNYYAWGETTTKTSYTLSTYKYYSAGYTKYTKLDGKEILDLLDDAARQNWGGRWRMPTKAEMEELISKCELTHTTVSGVGVLKITGPNGRYIIIPNNWFIDGTAVSNSEIYTPWVWTSSRCLGADDFYVWTIWWRKMYEQLRYWGLPVRAVFK